MSQTYSFTDIKMVISHPSYTSYVMDGRGLGGVSVAWADDNTVHSRGADGRVMPSKIKANNGTVTISVQQISEMQSWLMGLFNILNQLPAEQWALARIDISSKYNLADNLQLTGVSFQKRGDRSYQEQGQMVNWPFMFTDGQGMGTMLPAISVSPPANTI